MFIGQYLKWAICNLAYYLKVLFKVIFKEYFLKQYEVYVCISCFQVEFWSLGLFFRN